MMNTRMELIQIIHTFLSEILMINHHIIELIRLQDKKIQNDTEFELLYPMS